MGEHQALPEDLQKQRIISPGHVVVGIKTLWYVHLNYICEIPTFEYT